MAEGGLDQVLTLWLLQCVTVACFSEREGRRVLSGLQFSCCLQGGHAELVSKLWSFSSCTLFCTGCLHPSLKSTFPTLGNPACAG